MHCGSRGKICTVSGTWESWEVNCIWSLSWFCSSAICFLDDSYAFWDKYQEIYPHNISWCFTCRSEETCCGCFFVLFGGGNAKVISPTTSNSWTWCIWRSKLHFISSQRFLYCLFDLSISRTLVSLGDRKTLPVYEAWTSSSLSHGFTFKETAEELLICTSTNPPTPHKVAFCSNNLNKLFLFKQISGNFGHGRMAGGHLICMLLPTWFLTRTRYKIYKLIWVRKLCMRPPLTERYHCKYFSKSGVTLIKCTYMAIHYSRELPYKGHRQLWLALRDVFSPCMRFLWF